MKNGDLPAMPIQLTDDMTGIINAPEAFDNYMDVFSGLSKREMFAMAAMQGYCADGGLDYCFKTIAESAVGVADSLLAELEKSK